MAINTKIPVLGFVAASGTGKTSLLTKVIPLLKEKGLRIGMVKHTHHRFDMDQPGKDSYLLRKAGAEQMMIASKNRWALITEHQDEYEEPNLGILLGHIDQDKLDIILVEGFKHEAIPKIELHRAELDKPSFFQDDDNIIAFATDKPELFEGKLPVLDINKPQAVTAFIIAWMNNVGR